MIVQLLDCWKPNEKRVYFNFFSRFLAFPSCIFYIHSLTYARTHARARIRAKIKRRYIHWGMNTPLRPFALKFGAFLCVFGGFLAFVGANPKFLGNVRARMRVFYITRFYLCSFLCVFPMCARCVFARARFTLFPVFGLFCVLPLCETLYFLPAPRFEYLDIRGAFESLNIRQKHHTSKK